MSPEEYRAAVDAIIRRRGEEGDRAALDLAMAVASRIDQRVKEVDALLSEMKARRWAR
jgi:hypothetical protein